MIADDARGIGGRKLDDADPAISGKLPWAGQRRLQQALIAHPGKTAEVGYQPLVQHQGQVVPKPNRLPGRVGHLASSRKVLR